MNVLQEKLNFLIDKYSVDKKVYIKSEEEIEIDGEVIPNLSHRSERRFIELKNIANNGTLVGISVMRIARIVPKGTDLNKVLYRELDICRWILEKDFKSVTAFKNDSVLNIIAVTENDIVCTFEISATLSENQKPIDKHEIISQRGTACDTVVDAQLKQDSIYVFSDENKKYTDVDFELYGLSIEDTALIRFAFETAKNNREEAVKNDSKYILNVIEKVNKSIISGSKEAVFK